MAILFRQDLSLLTNRRTRLRFPEKATEFLRPAGTSRAAFPPVDGFAGEEPGEGPLDEKPSFRSPLPRLTA